MLALAPTESVTAAVNNQVPTVVGVPLISPVLDRVSPVGRVPDRNDQV
jgi:hypothetical protein